MKPLLSILLLSVVFASMLNSAAANYNDSYPYRMGMMGYLDNTGTWQISPWGLFMWIFMLMFMILLLVALIFLIIWLIQQIQRSWRRR